MTAEEKPNNLKKLRTKGRSFSQEFITFINRGNVMDLAVGVVVGSAFTAIVNSLVNDLIMPTISLIGGGFDFTTLSLKAGDATINYGNFLQNVVNFLIIAFVVFLIVKFLNKLHDRAANLKTKIVKK